MGNKQHISDELLAAYMEGNVNEQEVAQVLELARTDGELQKVLGIALQLDEEELSLQMAAEGGRNLCVIQCEAYVLKQCGINCDVDELLEVAKENHWIRRAGTPLVCIGNLVEYKGLKVMRKQEGTIENIRDALIKGCSIIAAVDSDKLYPERPDEEDATNHAVVVIGINVDDDEITIYDPANNVEEIIKLSFFTSAWRESRYYMVVASL